MFEITREIGIDVGHRIPLHESKCRNVHGHRYKIHCTIEAAELIEEGSETGMIMDFGFLKDIMMIEIDSTFDHALILSVNDSIVDSEYGSLLLLPEENSYMTFVQMGNLGKVILIKDIPTAENLARLWAALLIPEIERRSGKCASLKELTVWETPNCKATWRPNGNK